VTEKNPIVHLFEYHLPVDEHRDFQKKFSADTLTKIKTDVYKRTLGVGKELNYESVPMIPSKYGFECVPEEM